MGWFRVEGFRIWDLGWFRVEGPRVFGNPGTLNPKPPQGFPIWEPWGGLGLRVFGFGIRGGLNPEGFRIWDLGWFRVEGLGFSKFGIWGGLGLRVEGFRIWDLGWFRVEG